MFITTEAKFIEMFKHLETYGDRTALVSAEGETLTYAELVSLGESLTQKIKPRSLILSICKNHLDSIIGYVCGLRASHTQILLEDKINADSLKRIAESYHPHYIFAPIDKEITLENYQLKDIFRSSKLYELTKESKAHLHPELALLLSTSGSTGSPKMVKITFENLKANANSIIEYLQINEKDVAITTMPMAYSYGLSVLNTHLLIGAKVIVTDASLMTKVFWDAFKKYEATSLNGVPFFYEALKKLGLHRMQLPSLKYLTQAGGKLSTDLIRDFKNYCTQKNIHFYVMYGQTEATARIAYNCMSLLDMTHDRVGSIGKAIPNGKLWLEDDNGATITAIGTPGELVYSGPNVSMGYAESAHDLANDGHFQGVLRTGDIATIDEEGYFFIVGRKKNFLKIYGNRINLTDVEEFIKGQGHDVACGGEDNNLKIFIVGVDKPEEMRLKISQYYGLPLSGIQLIPIQHIPRNAAGKVLYAALNSSDLKSTRV